MVPRACTHIFFLRITFTSSFARTLSLPSFYAREAATGVITTAHRTGFGLWAKMDGRRTEHCARARWIIVLSLRIFLRARALFHAARVARALDSPRRHHGSVAPLRAFAFCLYIHHTRTALYVYPTLLAFALLRRVLASTRLTHCYLLPGQFEQNISDASFNTPSLLWRRMTTWRACRAAMFVVGDGVWSFCRRCVFVLRFVMGVLYAFCVLAFGCIAWRWMERAAGVAMKISDRKINDGEK